MLQTPPKPLTLDEFIKLPETKPASEYIDGQIIQKPMPQGEHSTIQGELIISINATVKPRFNGFKLLARRREAASRRVL